MPWHRIICVCEPQTPLQVPSPVKALVLWCVLLVPLSYVPLIWLLCLQSSPLYLICSLALYLSLSLTRRSLGLLFRCAWSWMSFIPVETQKEALGFTVNWKNELGAHSHWVSFLNHCNAKAKHALFGVSALPYMAVSAVTGSKLVRKDRFGELIFSFVSLVVSFFHLFVVFLQQPILKHP